MSFVKSRTKITAEVYLKFYYEFVSFCITCMLNSEARLWLIELEDVPLQVQIKQNYFQRTEADLQFVFFNNNKTTTENQ